MNKPLMGTSVSFYAVPNRTDELLEVFKKAGISASFDNKTHSWRANVAVHDFGDAKVMAALNEYGAMSPAHQEWRKYDYNLVRNVAIAAGPDLGRTPVFEEYWGQESEVVFKERADTATISLYVPKDMVPAFQRAALDTGVAPVLDPKTNIWSIEATIEDLSRKGVAGAIKHFGAESKAHADWVIENTAQTSVKSAPKVMTPVAARAEPAGRSLDADKDITRWEALAQAAKLDGRGFVSAYVRYGLSLSGTDEVRRAAQMEEIKKASPEELKLVMDRNTDRYRELYAREDKIRYEHAVASDPDWKEKLNRQIGFGKKGAEYKIRDEFIDGAIKEVEGGVAVAGWKHDLALELAKSRSAAESAVRGKYGNGSIAPEGKKNLARDIAQGQAAAENKVRGNYNEIVFSAINAEPEWKDKLAREVALSKGAADYKIRGEFSNLLFDEKKRLASLGRDSAVGLNVQERGLMTSLNRGFAAMKESYFEKTGIDVGGGVIGRVVDGSIKVEGVRSDRVNGGDAGVTPGVRKATSREIEL